ncbi:hypothetical protein C3V36_11060 [Lachnospiraceae bacterium oral taxon 500]|nr:hypothetical protein C3V36_11060 [Lachnospiraceae bacterium oral taxon 500]
MKLYKDKQGRKLYPVCGWEKNQHKIYNAHDRAMNRLYDEDYSEDAQKEVTRVERALEAFDRYVIQGIVYATYEESCLIKDIVGAYDIRHDMMGNWRTV